jgi:hypothetical protein
MRLKMHDTRPLRGKDLRQAKPNHEVKQSMTPVVITPSHHHPTIASTSWLTALTLQEFFDNTRK